MGGLAGRRVLGLLSEEVPTKSFLLAGRVNKLDVIKYKRLGSSSIYLLNLRSERTMSSATYLSNGRNR